MKLLVISTSIILIVCFGLVAICAETGSKTPPVTPAKADTNTAADVNATADVNAAAKEPNKAADKEIDQFKKELSQLEKASKKQDQDWTRQRIENRIRLLESSHEQVVAELNLIREIAAEEGATKTIKAIDLLIGKKNERLEELTQAIKEREIKDETREERDKDREKGKTKRLPERRDRRR